MNGRKVLYIGLLSVFFTPFLYAQRVMYCEPLSDRFTVRTELTGKVGDYYWVEMMSRRRVTRHTEDPGMAVDRNFVIYDEHMIPVNSTPAITRPDTLLKEYFVTGDRYFDQVNLLSSNKKVIFFLQRYEPNGEPADEGRAIGNFPFREYPNSFLLVRSEDRSRILILGFESMPSSSPRLHAILFDQDWRMIYNQVYTHPSITQPVIQDDFTNYPLEDFNNAPVKLANNGEWLMAVPSRLNQNFLLFHFDGVDTAISYKEIVLPETSAMEDVGLSIDNERGEAFAGVLSTYHYQSLKNVRVAHYSMVSKSFDFDSSYNFTTLSAGKVKNDNIVKENFIAVPGRGFMLLKEYGRVFENLYDDNPADAGWDPDLLFAANSIQGPVAPMKTGQNLSSLKSDGYVHYHVLGGPGGIRDRGDLSLYYLPASRGDTCWSGMISKEQVTELNSPNLSYLVIPAEDKLYFFYNRYFRSQDIYATTTVLDRKGESVPDVTPVFWQLKKTLSFQDSRQISAREIVIPYDRYQRPGFAIIRF
jgi:hypothetical protein